MRLRKKTKVFTKKFTKVYLIATACAAAVIIGWFALFWLFLDSYEKSVPENVASQVFGMYFSEQSADKLYAREKSSLSEFETLSSYAAYFSEKAAGGAMRMHSVPSSAEDIKRYAVFSGNSRFAEFELKQSAGFRMQIWKLSDISVDYDYFETFDIVVPAGYAVYVNGSRAGGTHKTEAEVQTLLAGLNDIYTIEGLLAEPAVEVRPAGGASLTLSYDADDKEFSAIPKITADILDIFSLYINGHKIDDSFLIREGIRTAETDRLRLSRKIYSVPVVFDEPEVRVVSEAGIDGVIIDKGESGFVQEVAYDSGLEARFTDLAIDAATTYAKFITNNSSLAELRRYFETGTHIYEVIRTSEVYWYTTHAGFWFENIAASEFFTSDGETFSSRVTFDQYIRRNAANLHMFPLDVTLFFRESSGRFLVYDMISNT